MKAFKTILSAFLAMSLLFSTLSLPALAQDSEGLTVTFKISPYQPRTYGGALYNVSGESPEKPLIEFSITDISLGESFPDMLPSDGYRAAPGYHFVGWYNDDNGRPGDILNEYDPFPQIVEENSLFWLVFKPDADEDSDIFVRHSYLLEDSEQTDLSTEFQPKSPWSSINAEGYVKTDMSWLRPITNNGKTYTYKKTIVRKLTDSIEEMEDFNRKNSITSSEFYIDVNKSISTGEVGGYYPPSPSGSVFNPSLSDCTVESSVFDWGGRVGGTNYYVTIVYVAKPEILPTDPTSPAPTDPTSPAPTDPTSPAPTDPTSPAPTDPTSPASTDSSDSGNGTDKADTDRARSASTIEITDATVPLVEKAPIGGTVTINDNLTPLNQNPETGGSTSKLGMNMLILGITSLAAGILISFKK